MSFLSARRWVLFLILAAGQGYWIYSFVVSPNHSASTRIPEPSLFVLLQEHYKPKLLSYFPQPITVENTEVFLGFPGPNKLATSQEHRAVVQFLNGLCQSNNNTRIERYPFSEASDIYFKVIAKDMRQTEFKFEALHHAIKTEDDEVILVDKNLMKLIYR